MTARGVIGRCSNDHEFGRRLGENEDWSAVSCSCGAPTVQRVVRYGEGVPNLNAKPRKSSTPFNYDRKWNCPNIGRHVRSDAQQHALNQRIVHEARTKAIRNRRSLSRKPEERWEHIARVPIEVYESVVENLNDRYAWQKDPVGLAKATETYFGEE